jgi:hypothetical protein
MIDTSPYHALFADSFTYRHQQIRILAGTTGRSVYQSHVYTADELSKAITRKKWDVVFVPGYFEKHDSMDMLIKAFCNLKEVMRPHLVVFHGTTDDRHFIRQLRNVGFIATHIPWDFMEPEKHERKDPKAYLPAEDNIQQLLLPVATRVEAN